MSSNINVAARANLALTAGSARCTVALVTDNSHILYLRSHYKIIKLKGLLNFNITEAHLYNTTVPQ